MSKTISTKQVFSYILKSLRPFPFPIFIMFLMAFIWAIDFSIRPYLLKVLLNCMAEQGVADLFIHVVVPAGAYIGVTFFVSTMWRLYDYFVAIKMIPSLRERLANDALGNLLDKSHAYYQNNFSGSLSSKINDLTSGVPELLQITIDHFLAGILALIIAAFVLWQVNPVFSLFMLGWTILFLAGSFVYSKRLSREANDWFEQGSIITGKIADVFSNILSVRLFNAKSQEKKNLNQAFQLAVGAEKKLQWSYFWMWLFYGYAFFIVQFLNLYFLIKGRQEGWVTVGDFALVLVINMSILEFLWRMVKDFSQFSKLLGRITQALQAILDVPDLQDAPAARELVVHDGRIVFDHVQFYYNRSKALFDDKFVEIEPGQKVGLVGYSGGGKTTFVNLILRLYDIHKGRILIDHQNIAQVTQNSLRQAIAMIPQDPSLFHRSLMDNIRYGCPDATDAQVFEAARRAHAHEFIEKIPQGYAAMVGERGVKLSGGQRQRIAIARAILKNAPILILDEATSQLDSVTESLIQDSLWGLMQGKTTLVVAHRLSTLLHMDRILVFDQGIIVEDGSHQQLLEKKGLYKILWDAQVGGFLPD